MFASSTSEHDRQPRPRLLLAPSEAVPRPFGLGGSWRPAYSDLTDLSADRRPVRPCGSARGRRDGCGPARSAPLSARPLRGSATPTPCRQLRTWAMAQGRPHRLTRRDDAPVLAGKRPGHHLHLAHMRRLRRGHLQVVPEATQPLAPSVPAQLTERSSHITTEVRSETTYGHASSRRQDTPAPSHAQPPRALRTEGHNGRPPCPLAQQLPRQPVG